MHSPTTYELEMLLYNEEKARELRLLLAEHSDPCLQCMTGDRCAWTRHVTAQAEEFEKKAARTRRLTGLRNA